MRRNADKSIFVSWGALGPLPTMSAGLAPNNHPVNVFITASLTQSSGSPRAKSARYAFIRLRLCLGTAARENLRRFHPGDGFDGFNLRHPL